MCVITFPQRKTPQGRHFVVFIFSILLPLLSSPFSYPFFIFSYVIFCFIVFPLVFISDYLYSPPSPLSLYPFSLSCSLCTYLLICGNIFLEALYPIFHIHFDCFGEVMFGVSDIELHKIWLLFLWPLSWCQSFLYSVLQAVCSPSSSLLLVSILCRYLHGMDYPLWLIWFRKELTVNTNNCA